MKKRLIITMSFVLAFFIILIVVLFTTNNKKQVKEYKQYTLDNYSFEVLKDYKYKYDKEKNRGYLTDKKFIKSYIYVSSNAYRDLISTSAYYEDMGGKEVDSDVDETILGEYDAFINVKEVEYKDTDEHDYLVIILIKVADDKTFVFQYETKAKENKDEILENVKEGLNRIEEKK